MNTSPLPRLTEQTIRNSIAEACADLRVRAEALAWGVDEYFEMWGALFPYGNDGIFVLHPNGAINDTERAALLPLVAVLNAAADATDKMSADVFLESPWAAEINCAAERAHAVMRQRGRFSEQVEEEEPTLPFS